MMASMTEEVRCFAFGACAFHAGCWCPNFQENAWCLQDERRETLIKRSREVLKASKNRWVRVYGWQGHVLHAYVSIETAAAGASTVIQLVERR